MAYIGKSPDGTGVRSRFYYTQTSGGGTSVSGSSDDGTSLAFSDGAYVDVFLNGVLLVAGTDYNTSTANTIAGLAALANGDVVEVVVYDIFTVADTVSSLNGGTFSGAVGFSGGITGDVAFDTNTLKVDSSNNRVGIGDATPDDTLTIYGGTAKLRVGSTDSNHVRIGRNTSTGHFEMMRTTTGATDQVFFKALEADDGNLILQEGGGNVLVGTTDDTPVGSGGISLRNEGRIDVSRDGGVAANFERRTSDGNIAQFYKDGSTVGSVGIESAWGFYVNGESGHAGLQFITAGIIPRQDNAKIDNVIDLGTGSYRYDDIHATNGTIQTSDQNEKQDIASLTTAEMTAAKAISKLFKTYKWKDKVAAKGDAARTHTGVIAQEVQTAMTDAGLDASKYAFWCSDTWWETSTEVAAVEADEEAGIEARDAYTRIDIYDTAEEAPEGATQRTRLGVRYPELLAFIGAATEQRLADIETRLTALEAGE